MCGFGFGYGAWWPWMIIRMGLGIAVVVGLCIWTAKIMRNNSYNRNDALQTLDLKFVNGEISEDEYIQKKKVIRGK
ncbi:SHOCT domain-containing protein [Anaeromicrobium sediminis]|uniref:SHOCT domain-containing protein n=1 Tax=Anaeromicrobium sediminis TaxID=1478221 RepID=A0A267MGK4_9FIRM|nr:SHOCT domain-containing protein [Anaeromicrobium sediminis]PAB58597.1 hypothetical protein CCE28_14025 [Anaeromicrobium sediminis]